MLTNNFLADKFPIEAEVRAETMEAEQGMRFPESSDLTGGETDCCEVRMEAQEPVGCVLYYEIAPYRGVCGATVGADGGGEFADVFLGDPEACATAAREKVIEMERRGTKLKNASILCNGDIYSYSGSHVTVTSLAPQEPVASANAAAKMRFFRDMTSTERRKVFEVFGIESAVLNEVRSLSDETRLFKHLFAAPQSPVPCQKCAEAERIEALATAKLGDEIIKNGSLQAKIAELEQEIERMKKERDEYKSAWQRAGEEYRKLRDSLLSLLGEFK